MSERFAELLIQAADARVAGEPVPPPSAIHARLRRKEKRRRRVGRLLPLLAGAAVVAVAVAAQQLTPAAPTVAPVAIPAPPELGTIVPPLEVRTRMGAPGGHVNGPPVAQADLLAVSPDTPRQPTLRTVGVVRPRPEPDAQGRALVDRCVYTYTEPASDLIEGSCQWARPPGLDPGGAEVTLAVQGAPGRTFLSGTAPAGTAAVQLQTPNQPDVLVATGPAAPQWNGRVHYVVWWPRVATEVVALAADGSELGRTRLPDPTPARTSPDDPELGTVELSPEAQVMFSRQLTPLGEVTTVDVLVSLQLDEHVTLYTYGHRSDDGWCTLEFVQDFSGDPDGAAGGGGGCGSGEPPSAPPLRVSRSYSAGTGEPGEQTLSGSAPAGTASIVLSADGLEPMNVPVYDAGARWGNRMYFLAAWPSAVPTAVRALDADGQTLATFSEKGLNPDSFEPEYLEAFAVCLEREGVTVTRRPQGHGVPPAYEYGADLPPERMRAVEAACEAEAGAALGD